jgi:hypothetical protein
MFSLVNDLGRGGGFSEKVAKFIGKNNKIT